MDPHDIPDPQPDLLLLGGRRSILLMDRKPAFCTLLARYSASRPASLKVQFVVETEAGTGGCDKEFRLEMN